MDTGWLFGEKLCELLDYGLLEFLSNVESYLCMEAGLVLCETMHGYYGMCACV